MTIVLSWNSDSAIRFPGERLYHPLCTILDISTTNVAECRVPYIKVLEVHSWHLTSGICPNTTRKERVQIEESFYL